MTSQILPLQLDPRRLMLVGGAAVALHTRTELWQSLPKWYVGTMPTRNISLTTEQDAFIEQVVDAGEYQNASEAVRDGLRALQQRRREDALKLKALRAAIKKGLDSIDQGDVERIDGSEIRSYLKSLTGGGRMEPINQLISTARRGRHPRRK